jgi:PadR family transcriptional regulator, regulatory protein PadR
MHSLSMQRLSMTKNRPQKKIDMMPGTLELLILKTLERHREPLHGYGIARHIQRVSDEVLQVEEGSLYPALQRLAIKGWVKAEWGISDNNRRARLYRLTPAGRKQLSAEVADFERLLEGMLRVVRPA